MKPKHKLDVLLFSNKVIKAKPAEVIEVDKQKVEEAYEAITSGGHILTQGIIYLLIDGDSKEIVIRNGEVGYDDAYTLVASDAGSNDIISAEFDGDDIVFNKADGSSAVLPDAKIELKGDKGDKGDDGDKIATGTNVSDYSNNPDHIGNIYYHTGNGNVYEVTDTGTNIVIGKWRGEDGTDGQDGAPFTYDDFTPEQLEGLKGDKGDKGEKGDKGDDGADGFPTESQWDDLVARVEALENQE